MTIKTQKEKYFNKNKIKINDNYIVIHTKYLLQLLHKLYKTVLRYESRMTRHPPAKSQGNHLHNRPM